VAAPAAEDTAGRRLESRAGLALFLAALLAYAYFVPRGPYHNPDSRLALTYSVVERHSLAIDPYAGTTDDRAYAGGHYYTDKAPGVSFLLAPPYALLRAVAGPALDAMGEPPGAADRFFTRYVLTLFGIGVPNALFTAVLFHWLRRVEMAVGPRLVMCVAYALGSPAFVFSTAPFGHVPAGICLFVAWALGRRWQDSPWRYVAAGALLGLAAAIEYPAAAAGLVVAALAVGRANRPVRAAGAVVAGAALPATLLGVYHVAAFGAPWAVGYAHLAPGSSFAAGQASALLGVGWPRPTVTLELLAGVHRGLIVYAPWVVLCVPGVVLLWRRDRGQGTDLRADLVAAGGVFAVLLAVNAGYVFWDGGASWGPRHLVPVLPFLLVPAVVGARRWPRAAVALVGASVALTLAAVATRTLAGSDVANPLSDALLPAALGGRIENNWGQIARLEGWRSLVPLLGVWLVLAVWAAGLGRSYGWALALGWALAGAATLSRAYVDYAEGYYLYLGSRLAAGARLYAGVASTQPPLLPAAIALLWRVQPDVYLPRLAALACYVATALLAGALAERVLPRRGAGPLATALAAVLSLGAGAPQVLDANATLAPLGPLLCLCWLNATPAAREQALPKWGSRTGWSVAAGIVAACGIGVKLTFAPFALAPLVAARGGGRRAPAAYVLAAGGTLLVVAAVWGVPAGPAAVDALVGELESPAQPLGPLLAYAQLLRLEGAALIAAAFALFAIGRNGVHPALRWCGAVAALLPVLAIHHGTFVGIARPGEPFVAVFAAIGVTMAGAGARAWRFPWVRGIRACADDTGHREGAHRGLKPPVRVAKPAEAGWAAAGPRTVGLVRPDALRSVRPQAAGGPAPFRGLRNPSRRIYPPVTYPPVLPVAPTRTRHLPAIVGWRHPSWPAAVRVLAAGGLLTATVLMGAPWRGLTSGHDPGVVLGWIAAPGAAEGDEILAPPFYAALARRRVLLDYPDWTVLGMRARSGAGREREVVTRMVSRIERGAEAAAVVDFRLSYVPEVEAALAARYVVAGDDGDVLARRVRRYVPR
jgi:hypothetical protein